jgi:hydrogenase maturation protein HypF
VTERYRFEVHTSAHPWTLDLGPTIRSITEEHRRGISVGEIAAKFHNTVAAAVAQVCGCIRSERNLGTVALSGGVFQNVLLLTRTVEALRAQHFIVLTNSLVPPNDGGLALGQAAVAVERSQRQCA